MCRVSFFQISVLFQHVKITLTIMCTMRSLFLTRSNGAMNNPMFGLKGPKMQEDTKGYDKNFALEFALKDVRFAQALGKEHGVKMDVSSAAQRKLLNNYLSITYLHVFFYLALLTNARIHLLYVRERICSLFL